MSRTIAVCARRMLGQRVAATAAVLLVPRLASACPVCFGASDGPLLAGSNMGILALLVVTLAVLGAFGGFFVTLAKRAARAPSGDVSPAAAAVRPEGLRQ